MENVGPIGPVHAFCELNEEVLDPWSTLQHKLPALILVKTPFQVANTWPKKARDCYGMDGEPFAAFQRSGFIFQQAERAVANSVERN